MKKISYIIAAGLSSLLGFHSGALGQPGSNEPLAAKSLLLSVAYVNSNNHLQYLKATAKTKIEGKFRFVPGINLRFYIQADSPQYLLGKATTNEKGEAIVYFPPGVKDVWMASSNQHFIVAADSGMGFSAASGEADLTKAKLQVDTASGRSVVVHLVELKKGRWTPVNGVDVKVAVRRMGGDLTIADAATYTTDSTGSFSADFKRDNLPGDSHGNITLVASVDDNDSYGTLSAEKSVPWGVYRPWVSDYDRRTLYARRGRSPLWLNFMAYSIILLVWGSLVYLLTQLIKIRRLGKAST
jgi:hypothetical protein